MRAPSVFLLTSSVVSVIAALALAVTPASASAFAALHWRSIGPAVSGGRVPAVAGSDRQPFLYYLGTADGGVFKTTNGGASWTAVFADKPVASIGAVVVSPSNPSDVWVGTGEGNPRADGSYGEGVWRSTDAAGHWEHLGLEHTSQITKILVDAKNPNTALVGALGDPYADSTDRGVFRTTDGGKTWRKTLYVGPSTGVSDLAADPRHPSVVFAGMWQFRRLPWNLISGGPWSGLYRSRDGGVHWEKLSGHGLPRGLLGRIGVAVAPAHPNRVYAIMQSKLGFVWRSDDGGDTWHRSHVGALVDERPFYFSHLFVDPTEQNHVYAVSVELSQSRDGARSFKAIENAENVDYHDMWFSSDGKRIIAGHDAGWALSLDSGKTWDWRTNVPVGQTYHIGFDTQNPYRVCGGFQDAETFCGPSNSLNPQGILNRDWLSLNASDGTWVWPDPLDPHLIWNDTYWGSVGIFDTTTQQEKDVSPYPHDIGSIPTAGLPYRFNWEPPMAFSPQDGHVMYLGGNALFTTKDRGGHWQASPDLTLNNPTHQQISGGPITIEGSGAEIYDTIVDIGPSAIEPGEIWVGTDDGLVQLTRDGGATWHNVSPKGVGPYGRVSTVEPSRLSGARAYAVYDRHMLGDRTPYIFRTEDYGATWRRLMTGLPAADYAHVVREDPHNASVLYAGLEQGIWISFDGGEHWQSLQNDLATSSVRDIRVHPVANDLIIGTHGRSLWVLDDLTPLQRWTTAKAATAFLFQPRTAYAFSLWEPEQPGWGMQPPLGAYAGENPAYGAIVSYYLAKKAKPAPAVTIVDQSGRTVRHLHASDGATNDRGINRLSWNLTEDPPVAWRGTPKWNRGPDDGPEAVPGHYTVRLHAGNATLVRAFDVVADPRAQFSQDQYIERHTFLSEVFQQLSDVDVALNTLDSLRRQLSERERRVKAHGGSKQLRASLANAAARGDAIFATLTSNPQASQDSDFLPDRLRERILFVIALVNYPLAGGTGDYGAAYLGPPTQPQYKEAADVASLYAAKMSAYRSFLKMDVSALNRALQREGYAAVR